MFNIYNGLESKAWVVPPTKIIFEIFCFPLQHFASFCGTGSFQAGNCALSALSDALSRL
jgi:hypothetical protein